MRQVPESISIHAIQDFQKKKQAQQKISMVTCYDYTFALLVQDSPIDVILVGDSVAMIMHGEETTIPATIEMMCWHTRAVRKGAPKKWIVTDLPFLSYRAGFQPTIENVLQCMHAGANAVKLEGIAGNEEIIYHLVESGVPVMGHLGLTPQSVHQLGGMKVQARQEKAAEQLRENAKRCERAGCFALVLECVPAKIAAEITRELTIPVIGIGAGNQTDGQVLVLQDLLGMQKDFKPKFLKHYLNGAELIQQALESYHHEVTTAEFPSELESYA